MRSHERLRAGFGTALSGCEPGLATADRLCTACVELLDVDGAAISLMYGGSSRGTFGSSGELGRRLDDVQFTVGEGPCLDAVEFGRPVLVTDFSDLGEQRWPAYAEAVRGTGIRALDALPVAVNTVVVGALDLYRAEPGALSDAAFAGGLMAARLAALPLMDLMTADVDWAALEQGDAWAQLESLERVEVYQATGMIMGRLGVGPTEALVRLRAYAYAHTMTASEVAWAVVGRRIAIAPDAEHDGKGTGA